MELYRSLREGIPVIDAAIYKLIRLLGNFEIICSDEKAERDESEVADNRTAVQSARQQQP